MIRQGSCLWDVNVRFLQFGHWAARTNGTKGLVHVAISSLGIGFEVIFVFLTYDIGLRNWVANATIC